MDEMKRDQNQELESAIQAAMPEFVPPPGLDTRILAAATTPDGSPRRRWRLALGGAFAAAVVAAVLFLHLTPRAPMVVLAVVKPPVTDGWGRTLKAGDKLPAGTTIRTGREGRVTMLTRQGAEFTLNANSELALARDRRAADLRRGEIYCHNRRHEIARIETAAGRITLLGTALDVAVQKPTEVAVTVVSGQVRLANAHGEAVVPAGRRTMLVASRAPQEGTAVDTASATSWYSGKLDIVSDYGEIVYHMIRESGRVLELWAMNADGSHKHLVKRYVGGTLHALGPWIAGEQWILIGTDSPFLQLSRHLGFHHAYYLLNVATGQDVPILLPDNYDVRDHALSPDGTRLVFGGYYWPDPSRRSDWDAGTWRYDLESGRITKLTDFAGLHLAWSPDGRRLAVSYGGRQGYTEEFRLALVDAGSGAVADLGVHGIEPCFSPGGRKLAYSGDYHEDASDHNIRKGRVFVLDLAPGSTALPISPGNQHVGGIRWSPDGTRVAHWTEDMKATNPDGGPVDFTLRLYTAAADGSDTRPVYRADTWTRAVSWAPSGDAFYIATADGGLPKGVLLVAADGSGVTADLGGTVKDSVITAAEQAQIGESYKVLKEVESLQRTAWEQAFLGKAAESKDSYHRISNLLTRLTWDYPLAAFSHNSLLRYSDIADDLASRSPETVLREVCAFRLTTMANHLMGGLGPFPSAAEFRDRAAHYAARASSPKDRPIIETMYQCPKGDVTGKPTVYTYNPPPPHADPPLGHVLLSCPFHPENRVVWDRRLQRRLDSYRNEATMGQRARRDGGHQP